MITVEKEANRSFFVCQSPAIRHLQSFPVMVVMNDPFVDRTEASSALSRDGGIIVSAPHTAIAFVRNVFT